MAERALLDTHTLLWVLTEPTKLSAPATALIADRRTQLFVSAASAWEIATKQRIGKLPQADSLVVGFARHLRRAGLDSLPITDEHALSAGGLTWSHRDPFDRMIAAVAMIESLPLISADSAFSTLHGVRIIW